MIQHDTLKNPSQEQRLFQHRVIAVCVIVALLLGLLIARLIYLQIIQHKLYTTLSKQNQLTLLPIEPKRGLIYDRNGILIAENIPVFSLELTKEHISDLDDTIARLNKLIPISEDDITAFQKQLKQTRRYHAVPLKMHLTEDEVARFEVNRYQFPGVAIKARLIRQYPQASDLAHVLGYMGRINAQELAHVDASNYSDTNYIGKNGLEKYYEEKLHGKTGYQQVESDASGRIVRVMKRIPPIAGEDLYLALDSKLQHIAYQAMGNAPGSLVAIDPQNGEVLAMVSNPSFDPNLFVLGMNQKQYNQLQSGHNKPLFNRTVHGLYPIASTIKPFIALQALESHAIDRNFTIADKGYFKLPHNHHIYHDWNPAGHGYVDVHKAIVQSCDTFFYIVSNMIGIEQVDNILFNFGFGEKTHIDLPGELSGLVATPDWKIGRFGQRWYTGDTLNSGIGQGYMLTTPTQLASAVASLSMRGERFQPHLIHHTQLPNGKTHLTPIKELAPVQADQTNWDIVLKAMRGVIKENHGTGFRFGRTAPYSVAAKTGTAQVYSSREGGSSVPVALRDHSMFIAFAPYKHSKIAIAIVAEHSLASAPEVARQIMDYYLLEEKHASSQH